MAIKWTSAAFSAQIWRLSNLKVPIKSKFALFCKTRTIQNNMFDSLHKYILEILKLKKMLNFSLLKFSDMWIIFQLSFSDY